MKYNICLFLTALVICFSSLHAQKYYLFHTYTTNEGLANNNIMTINQDRYGYIWIGTDAGVSKFDGYTFDNKAIPVISGNSAFVEYIEKDSLGNLIITGFMQGIHVQQPNGAFKQYLSRSKQIGKNCPNTLKTWIKNSLLVGESRKLSIFKDGKFKMIYDVGNNMQAVTTIERDISQNIWFGGYFGLATIACGDSTYAVNFLPELKDKYIIKILFDQRRTLWIGTSQGLFKLVFNKSGEWKKGYKLSQPFVELTNTFINHLYFDSDKNLWVSTSTLGVFKINKDKIIETITSVNGLPNDRVMCTFQDNEKNYWFGTNYGLCKLSGFNKFAYAYNRKKLENIETIAKDSFGRYWISSGTNLYMLKNNKIDNILLDNSPIHKGGIKLLLIDPHQKLWIANHNGLFTLSLDDRTPDFKKIKQVANFKSIGAKRIKSLTCVKDNIWLCFDKEIYLFRNDKLLLCKINCPTLNNIRPNCIVQDHFGYFWIGDFNFGLYRMKLIKIDNNFVEFDSVKVYQSLKPDSAFVNAWVQDLKIDHEGNLWQASLYSGVYKLKLDASKGVVGAKLYSTKNGLSSNMVTQVVEDQKHRVWFATQEGADCLTNDNGSDKIIHYNKKDGLGTQVEDILPDVGMVYLIFSEGLFAVENGSSAKSIINQPNVFITNIAINGKSDTVALANKMPAKYLFNQNYVAFEFVSVSFQQENAILYQYILEGLDKSWCNFTDRRYVGYNSLPPGKYIFKVRAKSEEGILSQTASFTFVIRPPFYKTWWFMLLSAGVLILVVTFAYQYRIKQILKLERLRTRIASDLHDDVGSTLSSISILSEILAIQPDNNPKSADLIGKIGVNARNMLESMDDIIWAVNPANDKFQNLGLRIREFAIPLFESKDIKFQIHFSEHLATLHLPMDVRRNVYLIAKEAINNLVKYAECTQAEIRFYEEHVNMVMIIKDDGKGFNPAHPSSRNGLKNMQRRADQIGATLEIYSEPGKGACISLIITVN
jgi:signal transduction histidine kinase/ligand-binding sensor domain-containing protein